MDEISDLLKKLDCDLDDDELHFEYIKIFKNPNNLPITQLHLEKIDLELPENVNINDPSAVDRQTQFVHRKRVIPALHKDWLPSLPDIPDFQPYDFTLSKEENANFAPHNRRFLEVLHYLLRCDYHQFWCSILFEPEIARALHSFISNPIMPHEIQELDGENLVLYETVFTQYYLVYRRLLTYHESKTEFMFESVAFQFLTDNKLLSSLIVITLITMYKTLDLNFINKLVDFYFGQESIFTHKEVEQVLEQILMSLEMIGGHVCGFETDSVIVPIAVEPRPKIFSLAWVHNVVNYLLNTASSLNALLKFYEPSLALALGKNLPYRLTYTYEKVYKELYEYLKEREVVESLEELVLDVMALGRSEFIECYNAFVSYCLNETLKAIGNSVKQNEFIEEYLNLMTTALDDEYFICDYHNRYNIAYHNEMFVECSEIDTTRTDYIINCVESLKRHTTLRKSLKSDRRALSKSAAIAAAQKSPEKPSDVSQPSTSKLTEQEIDALIAIVIDMFPHLGDGFVLECLVAYDYQPNDVIAAILEENLPPHISDIPFDLIRIPPEPEPAKPILAYKGKKPGYDDALKLLNDKKDMEKIKTFVLDGIKYSNEYDPYDDEYDDREDEETIKMPEYGTEEVLKYNPNYEEVVSDTSYSENEYDEEAKPVNPKNKANFCEDPAVIRARREAQRGGGAGRSRDVVGKPKGQGQEKNVQQNRQKKATNKSSRANHNRKGGAQWKRTRGMVPS